MNLRLDKHPEKYKILASLLPDSTCPRGCTTCCDDSFGLAINYDLETGGNSEIIMYSTNHEPCRRCVNEGCEIYEVRPLICRLFWKCEDHPSECPEHVKAPWLLTKEEFRRFLWCAINGTLQDARALKAFIRR